MHALLCAFHLRGKLNYEIQSTYLGSCFSALTAAPAFAGNLNNAKSSARGNTGISSSDVQDASLNPANLAGASDNMHFFSIATGFGAYVTDQDEAIDQVDDAQDLIDRFDGNIRNIQWSIEDALNSNDFAAIPGIQDDIRSVQADVAEVDRNLKELSDKQVSAEVGGTLFQVSGKAFGYNAALFAKNSTQVAASFGYHNDDHDKLNNIMSFDPDDPQDVFDHKDDFDYDKDDLKSTVNATAVSVFDFGLAMATEGKTKYGRLDYGATVKYQQIWLADKSLRIADFSNSDLFDSDRDITKHNTFNLDLGATQYFADTPWRASVVGENLIPYTAKASSGNKFKLSPQVTVGGAYDKGWFLAEANVELLKNQGFNGYSAIEDTQFIRAGAEFGLRKLGKLRAGYIHDLKGNQEDLYTAGFGISPFDVVNIDISGMVGPARTYGAMLGLGFKI